MIRTDESRQACGPTYYIYMYCTISERLRREKKVWHGYDVVGDMGRDRGRDRGNVYDTTKENPRCIPERGTSEW